jgi:type VI secretion system secreted protein VgrG
VAIHREPLVLLERVRHNETNLQTLDCEDLHGCREVAVNSSLHLEKSMPTYVQAERPLRVTTPLGKDALLLVGFTGQEALSQLFHFQLEVLAENKTDVAFDKLLGQKITVDLALPGGKRRYFNGVCSRVSQGTRDFEFTAYQLEIVPQFWLLSKRAQSRIFQHMPVPDILKKVLEGLDVTYEIQGTFHPRDFCVQYRETDFNFASRLMEEEGIYYFFKHSAGGHQMVLANTPQSHPTLPEQSTLIFEDTVGGGRPEDRILEWHKVQELRSGKYTLWDHCFELPHKHLEADKTILESVPVGKVTHKQKVGNNDKLEIYDYPGDYAQRFDGIDKGGGERPADLQKIFEDNKRTVAIRQQQETVPGLFTEAISTCRQLVAGYKFALTRHFNADGQYVITAVQHNARTSTDYRSNGGSEYQYQNSFTCIPFAQPYRPPRSTPKPLVQGTQTAVVVGPPGEEIFPDKYSRVKVQFHWDRQGKNNADSSCWCRVSTLWAGKQWGMIHIPRIGQEVIVDFLEGDPDQPIIVGSVYNADMMPPYKLPDNKTQSGIKTRSSMHGGEEDFNEICFEDKKGSELLYIRAEKDQIFAVENDQHLWAGNDRTKEIDHDEDTKVHHDRTETVGNNETITIGVEGTGNRTETVKGDETITIKGNRTEEVRKDETITIKGNRTEEVKEDEGITIVGNRTKTVKKDETISIAGNRTENVKKTETVSVKEARTHQVGENDTLDVGKVLAVKAGESITLTTGKASICMNKDGTIIISGVDITTDAKGEKVVKAAKNITMKGQKILQN